MKSSDIMKLAEEIGFSHISPLNREALILRPEIRTMCESQKCRNYGHSWSCPPACGSLPELEKRISLYGEGILLQTTGQMKDSFDSECIEKTEKLHKAYFDTLVRQVRMLNLPCMPMTAGGCRRCHKCTYPDHPCRYPEKLYPSMEACGLWVSEVCRLSGMEYYYGPDTITYTACLLF